MAKIKKTLYLCVLSLILALNSAYAADSAKYEDKNKKDESAPATAPAPLFDYAFGGKLMSDYISRGITQTNHSPGATAYGELRLNPADWLQAYAGTQFWRTELPTQPTGELDLYGGLRPTFGNFSADLGYIYYLYPNNGRQYWTNTNNNITYLAPAGALCPAGNWCAITPKDPSYYELYFKPGYNFTEALNIGTNSFYSPNYGNTGPKDFYNSVVAKYTFTPNWSVSGEFGHQSFTNQKGLYNYAKLYSYETWNAGVTYTYGIASLDVRYSGSDLSKAKCYTNGSDPKGNLIGQVATGRSNWCDTRVMATFSVDLTSKDVDGFLGKKP